MLAARHYLLIGLSLAGVTVAASMLLIWYTGPVYGRYGWEVVAIVLLLLESAVLFWSGVEDNTLPNSYIEFMARRPGAYRGSVIVPTGLWIAVAPFLTALLIIGVLIVQGIGRMDRPGASSETATSALPIALAGQETITLADFQEQVRVVESNLAYMQGEIEAGSASSDYLRACEDLIGRHGVENVALATLIKDRVLFQVAITRGYVPSEAEVAAKVRQDQGLVGDGGADAAAARAYINAVGEQRYWSEIYLEIARRELAVQELWMQVTNGASDHASQVAAWQAAQRQAVSTTPVTVLDAAAMSPATVEAALKYLDHYWQLPQP